MKKSFTGMKDEIGNEIFLGDRLWCMDGYDVIVKRDKYGYYGKLVCDPNHSCAHIPYSLNNGKRHIKTFQIEAQEDIKERLEYLRKEIIAERISYEEIAELQSLIPHIEPGDVLLLEWAGVPEVEEILEWAAVPKFEET